MDYWNRLRSSEDNVINQTLNDNSVEHSLIRDTLSLLIRGLEIVPPPEINDHALLARVTLLSQNLNNFMVVFDCSRRGYYVQAISLLRIVYYNWLSFWYLAKYPDDAQLWLDPSQDRKLPTAETMRNKIDHPSKCIKKEL